MTWGQILIYGPIFIVPLLTWELLLQAPGKELLLPLTTEAQEELPLPRPEATWDWPLTVIFRLTTLTWLPLPQALGQETRQSLFWEPWLQEPGQLTLFQLPQEEQA